MNLIPAPNGFMCPDDPGEPMRKLPRWSVNATEARIVAEFCRGLHVLEIGTGLGVSTKEIARLATWVHTVDIDPWIKETVAPTLPPNVTFYADTKELPKRLGAAFIDGWHDYDQCTKDIKLAKKIVKREGLFIFHDVKIRDVAMAIQDSGLEWMYVETYAGMAIAWR
jgi:hypothetical protein